MAYALEPLIQILELTDPTLIQDVKPQLDSLLSKSHRLRKLLATVPQMTSREDLAVIETRIRRACIQAEDILEPFIAGRVISKYEGRLPEPPELTSLPDVEEQLHSATVDLDLLIESGVSKDVPPLREPAPVMKIRVVGFLDILANLTDLLYNNNFPRLRTIPLMGMGGIGKTTIAQELHSRAKKNLHFDIFAWVTVSQRFDTRAVLLALLESLHKKTKDLLDETDERLGELLYKTLFGRRYFIVVDDLWTTNAWDKLRRFFPDQEKGSRILLTTRLQDVAEHTKLGCDVQKMRFLFEDESYELISERVFAKTECPGEFADTGRKIAINCKGLPLAIVVIAGILVASKQTLEFWQLIEQRVGSTLNGEESVHFNEVLSLSYHHLPYYLRPCFLYIGAFPEDAAIRCSRLIYLWVAEGFLTPFKTDGANTKTKNWEDTAETYINALMERNLIFPRRYESTKKVITFGIHDMLRSMCHEKSREENFFWFENIDDYKHVDAVRRVSAHPSSELMRKKDVITPVRSFVCITHATPDLADAFFSLKLLRVLDVYDLIFYQFPPKLLEIVNLRYLAFSSYTDLPASLARFIYLRNLMICREPSFRTFILPTDMWGMTQLRHIKSKESFGCYFPTAEEEATILVNLLTLANIQMSGMTNDLFKRFPNLRKLGLCCNDSMPHETDVTLLKELDALKCSTDWSVASHRFLFSIALGDSLKKLTLFLCKIPKQFLQKIAELPNLEHLKLRKSDFLGPNDETTEAEWVTARPEWELEEDKFPKLISLVMDDLNLVHMTSEVKPFQVLERLTIRDCCSLETIPEYVGDIETLVLIEVDESCPPVLATLKEIRTEQRSYENFNLEFHFYSSF